MEERNTNFFINDGLIMQGEQIDTSVAVKIALDHGWSSIKGEHIFMETLAVAKWEQQTGNKAESDSMKARLQRKQQEVQERENNRQSYHYRSDRGGR